MWCLCGKVKKTLNTESKDKSNQNKSWFKKRRSDPNSIEPEPATLSLLPPPTVDAQDPPRLSEAEKEQIKHAYTLAMATTKAAEAAAAAAQAATEVVRLTTSTTYYAETSNTQDLAAIKIQTTFRRYLARRALRNLRGLKRLQTMMQGEAIKRQTANTLKTMQTLAQMQWEIRERRMKMAEENMAHQKLIQQKHAKEQAKQEHDKSQKILDGWDSSITTKEEIAVKLQSRNEAAVRRERTLAYSYTHQQTWKAAARSATTLFMDQNNPHWGWSWMERWLATRPWETVTMPEKDSNNNNYSHVKGSKFTLSKKEMAKSQAHFNNTEKPPPISIKKQTRSTIGRLSTSSAPSKSVSSPIAARKLRSQTPKTSPRARMWGPDEDTRSMVSKCTGQSRRTSCSSAKDDNESLASSQTVPSYMAPTHSAKARSRSVTPDRFSVSSVKKGSSYTPSPTRSRRSTSSAADANSISEHT